MQIRLLQSWRLHEPGFVLKEISGGVGTELIRRGIAELVLDDNQPAKKEKKAHAPLAGYAANR